MRAGILGVLIRIVVTGGAIGMITGGIDTKTDTVVQGVGFHLTSVILSPKITDANDQQVFLVRDLRRAVGQIRAVGPRRAKCVMVDCDLYLGVGLYTVIVFPLVRAKMKEPDLHLAKDRMIGQIFRIDTTEAILGGVAFRLRVE